MIKNPRSETRTNYKAFMHISFKRDLSKWIVSKFDSNHNHPFASSSMYSFDAISEKGGKEFVGFMREDQKTYLRAKRQRNLQYGEAGSLLSIFQQQVAENPYFTMPFSWM
ncbi:uncharacterized protein LOC114262176 [Camellia sinensis]|uniref:uncharacterized protein LOC114262176 n=1 Tax=Camellia sinensis TaxID=4442 RepID=UPI001035CEF6|nr:uncharacterized protein LOC114262176 [Camellia sinensis]